LAAKVIFAIPPLIYRRRYAELIAQMSAEIAKQTESTEKDVPDITDQNLH
jgi:hypothetical protein